MIDALADLDAYDPQEAGANAGQFFRLHKRLDNSRRLISTCAPGSGRLGIIQGIIE